MRGFQSTGSEEESPNVCNTKSDHVMKKKKREAGSGLKVTKELARNC